MGKCLLLREKEPNDRYESLLSLHGLTPHSIPVIQNTILSPGHESDPRNVVRIPELDQYEGVIITSRHAVEFIRINNVDLAGKKLGVVGPNTSLLLEKIGLKPDYINNNAAELSDVILAECDGLRWLYFKGNLSLDIISGRFRNSDHSVDELVVYVTEKSERCSERIAEYARSEEVDKIDEIIQNVESVQWIVFFSPSGVMYSMDSLLECFPSSVKLIAFGPSTAKEVRKWFEGYEVRVCKSPTPQGVLACILSDPDS